MAGGLGTTRPTRRTLRPWSIVASLLLASGCAELRSPPSASLTSERRAGSPAAATRAGTVAPVRRYHAAQPGRTTLDRDEQGGNPFASALIEGLARAERDVREFGEFLRRRTAELSRGYQDVDLPSGRAAADAWGGASPRVALVFVRSRYEHLLDLDGAAHDARRIASALEEAGFDTILLLDPASSREEAALRAFQVRSAEAELALIYATGHGRRFEGRDYLLGPAYSSGSAAGAESELTLGIDALATCLRGTRINVLFWAGCRDER